MLACVSGLYEIADRLDRYLGSLPKFSLDAWHRFERDTPLRTQELHGSFLSHLSLSLRHSAQEIYEYEMSGRQIRKQCRTSPLARLMSTSSSLTILRRVPVPFDGSTGMVLDEEAEDFVNQTEMQILTRPHLSVTKTRL